MTLQQENDALADELSSRGAAWIDVGCYDLENKREIFSLDLMAVVHVERDTNAAIINCVGEGEDVDGDHIHYPTEEMALLAAIAANKKLLDEAKLDPHGCVWLPAGYDEW